MQKLTFLEAKNDFTQNRKLLHEMLFDCISSKFFICTLMNGFNYCWQWYSILSLSADVILFTTRSRISLVGICMHYIFYPTFTRQSKREKMNLIYIARNVIHYIICKLASYLAWLVVISQFLQCSDGVNLMFIRRFNSFSASHPCPTLHLDEAVFSLSLFFHVTPSEFMGIFFYNFLTTYSHFEVFAFVQKE